MRDFRKLSVWQKAHSLVIEIYRTTADFPKTELCGLTSQIRRSCISTPANIAEGCGREGKAELVRFLNIAFGSANELEYHLLLSYDLNILNKEKYDIINFKVTEIKKMLTSLIQKLKADN